MFKLFVKLFKRPAPTREEKLHKHAVDMIYAHAHEVLTSLARPHESDWTEATKATVMGYVVGSTFEYSYLKSLEDREDEAFEVLQKFGDKKLDPVLFSARLARYVAERGKHYRLGIEAATYDYRAGRKNDLVYAFLEAVRYPDNTTFNIDVEEHDLEARARRKPLGRITQT